MLYTLEASARIKVRSGSRGNFRQEAEAPVGNGLKMPENEGEQHLCWRSPERRPWRRQRSPERRPWRLFLSLAVSNLALLVQKGSILFLGSLEQGRDGLVEESSEDDEEANTLESGDGIVVRHV